MTISPESIDAIKHAADIVEVVSQYVTLTKKASNYVAFCPFEEWRSSDIPLFCVNVQFQIYKCFCCGCSGDSVKFVMDIRGIGYQEALQNLADKFQIEVIEVNPF